MLLVVTQIEEVKLCCTRTSGGVILSKRQGVYSHPLALKIITISAIIKQDSFKSIFILISSDFLSIDFLFFSYSCTRTSGSGLNVFTFSNLYIYKCNMLIYKYILYLFNSLKNMVLKFHTLTFQ